MVEREREREKGENDQVCHTHFKIHNGNPGQGAKARGFESLYDIDPAKISIHG